MTPTLEQFEKWGTLGLRVAIAVQCGECQERERHIPVSGQIRGYLRWYADLTFHSGYWPLAEAIAYALQEGSFDHSKLKWLTELFATEQNKTPEQIEKLMTAVAWVAVDKKPDFASLVMGGTTKVNFLLRFINSSMHWLTQYQLSLRDHSWSKKEAYWVYKRESKVRRDAAYISTEDYLIVSELSRGQGRRKIAQKLGCTLQHINEQYQKAVERAELIVSKASAIQIPTGRDNWDIADYLNYLGMSPYIDGYTVLKTAISLAQEQPGLLNNMTEQFYPALGEKTNKAPGTMNRKVRNAISSLIKNPNCAEFLQFAGFTEKNINLSKKFFEAFLKYMDQ